MYTFNFSLKNNVKTKQYRVQNNVIKCFSTYGPKKAIIINPQKKNGVIEVVSLSRLQRRRTKNSYGDPVFCHACRLCYAAARSCAAHFCTAALFLLFLSKSDNK